MVGDHSRIAPKVGLFGLLGSGNSGNEASMETVLAYLREAHPDAVMIQDGPEPFDVVLEEVTGAEKARWWERAVAAYPPYADYQAKTARQIPVFVATPKEG